MPENRELIEIILKRLAREGLERLPAVGGIIAAYMQTLDDIDTAIREEAINRALEELRQQLKEVTTIIELLEHPKTLESLENLETSEQLQISGQSVELREIVANFIAYLKDPSKAYLDYELKAAIEKYALSKGTLDSINKLTGQKGILVKISDLEIGKSFFPLHFIRQSFQALAEYSNMLQNPPLRALFDPLYYLGYPKWVCVVSENDQLTLTAYPKLIKLDSVRAGRTKQLDDVTISPLNSSNKFEYWPNGDREPKFVVEVNLDNPVQLKFQEKSSAGAAALYLQLSYTGG